MVFQLQLAGNKLHKFWNNTNYDKDCDNMHFDDAAQHASSSLSLPLSASLSVSLSSLVCDRELAAAVLIEVDRHLIIIRPVSSSSSLSLAYQIEIVSLYIFMYKDWLNTGLELQPVF